MSSVNDAPYDVVMLGAGGVGKSSLCQRIVNSTFVDSYDPTVEDLHHTSLEFDGKPCSINLVDTAGQGSYDHIRREKMRKGEGFIIVYAINDKQSFKAVSTLYAELLEERSGMKQARPPVIVVGNKCDLGEVQVTDAEIKKLESDLRLAAFKTSAKDGQSVVGLFLAMLTECRNARLEKSGKPENTGPACCVLS